MSTCGSVTSTSPTSTADDVRKFTTPAGMSVVSATTRPSAAEIHGVCGGDFTTTVHPAASAGTILASVIWTG